MLFFFVTFIVSDSLVFCSLEKFSLELFSADLKEDAAEFNVSIGEFCGLFNISMPVSTTVVVDSLFLKFGVYVVFTKFFSSCVCWLSRSQ